MYKPTGLSKIYVQEKTMPLRRKLPKSLTAFFTISQLCCGLHFGCVNPTSKNSKKAVKFLTACMGCVMIAIMIISFNFSELGGLWLIYFLIQYIPTFFILMSTKYSLYEFLTDLIATEERPVHVKANKLGIIAWFYTILFVFHQLITFVTYCFENSVGTKCNLFLNIPFQVPLFSLNLIPVANFILFYCMFVRMRDLKVEVERQEINAERLRITFKGIADIFENFRRSYDAVFFLGFLIDSSKWMIMIWQHLNLMNMSNSWLLLGCSYVLAFNITMQICVPAAFAEMISVQTDAIKKILHHRCLTETDEAVSKKWAKLLRYMEARPLVRKAWRLVPVDLQLPITMLSMCVTYVIVIIQFTHLYD